MSANSNDSLIAAIRAGDQRGVVAALDAGADPNLADQLGEAGLPLRLAAFGGNGDIIRELAGRGGDVNHSTRRMASAPLTLAVRTGKTETVRLLIELGAHIPAGTQTGLSLKEILAAQGVAYRTGAHAPAATPTAHLPNAPLLPEAPPPPPAGGLPADAIVEEIDLQGCYGVDTNVLEADARRLAQQAAPSEAGLDVPPLDTGKPGAGKKK